MFKWVRKVLSTLLLVISSYIVQATDRKEVTQLLVVPYEFALTHPEESFGGIIYISRDIKPLVEYGLDTIESLNEYFLIREDHPFIMIDEEGGAVSRLKYFEEFRTLCQQDEDITEFVNRYNVHVSYVLPSEREIGEAYARVRDNQSTEFLKMYYRYNRSIAKILRELGFNTVLAPVVDLCDSGYMKNRSYSSDPTITIELSGVMIRAFEDEGMFTCTKHFAGLGDIPSNIDPHEKAVYYLHTDINQMLPFYILESDMVMVSHGIYIDVDTVPLSVSLKAINMLPEHRIVVSDDISMGTAELLWKNNLFEDLVRVNDLVIVTGFNKPNPEKEINQTITHLNTLDTSLVNEKVRKILKIKRAHEDRFLPVKVKRKIR